MFKKTRIALALTIAVVAATALVPGTANAQVFGQRSYSAPRYYNNLTPSGYYGSYYYNGAGNVGVFNGSPYGQGFNGVFSGVHRPVYVTSQPTAIYAPPAVVPTKEPPTTAPSR